MKIFEFNDYRQVIKKLIDEKKSKDSSITYASFAEVIGVQKTFVSKVLKELAHFSDDHLHLAFEYFQFNDIETQYMKLLYDHNRSGLNKRKSKLMKEISRIQEEQRQFHVHTRAEMQKPELTTEMAEYYLDPLNLIVHAHMGIPKYQNQPSLLSNALGISQEQLQTCLQTLQRLKIVQAQGKKIIPMKEALHLDVRSMFCKPHQMLFRIRSQERLMDLTPESRFMLSTTFSGTEEMKAQIQEHFLIFMKQVEKLIQNAEISEKVYQLNFDLFPWTDSKS